MSDITNDGGGEDVPEQNDEFTALAGPTYRELQDAIEEPTGDQFPIGVDMNLPFITPYKDQWEVVREDDISVEKLVSMRKTDGQARALFRLMTLPILAGLKGISVLPYDGKKGGEDEAKFVLDMLTLAPDAGGMEISLRKVMENFLLAVFDGFAAAELVIGSAKVGPNKGKWVIKKIAPRPAETISFLVDGRGNWTGLRQLAYVKGVVIDEKIPKERALYYAANEAEKPFYGISFFHAAFFHWDKKVRLYFLAHLMAQRSAVGTRIGTYPKNADPKKVAKFIRSISDLGTNQWMAKEEFFLVESLKEGGSFDFLGLINHHNSQMSKSILADFFDENQGAGAGDGAFVDFGKQSDALFIMMLEHITAGLEEIINNNIIPQFIQWNFANDMYPTFKWGPISQDARNIIVDMFKTLMIAANQGNVTPEFIFELEKLTAKELGVNLDYDTIEKERDEQAAKEKEQQDQMMAAQQSAGTDPNAAVPGSQPLDVPPDLLPPGFNTSGGGAPA